MAKTRPFDEHTPRYEEWFEHHEHAYRSELEAVRKLIPDKGNGIEIGVGSGRFAVPLGINTGVEPSEQMRRLAEQRGIETLEGTGENLPVGDSAYSYALMVTTLCFLDDVKEAFSEVYRILEPGGFFINGFVDRESPLGKVYQRHKNENVFYRDAVFYSTDEVVRLMGEAGFDDFRFTQTIFHLLPEIKNVEPVKEGYGEGSFVAVRGRKGRTLKPKRVSRP